MHQTRPVLKCFPPPCMEHGAYRRAAGSERSASYQYPANPRDCGSSCQHVSSLEDDGTFKKREEVRSLGV